jgi:hypothetical protein
MNLAHRVYADFLKPSRMPEFERLLSSALTAGYRFMTLPDYFARLVSNGVPEDRVFILRHDIDTDPKTAARFLDAERRHGVCASYYFRLSTWDNDLVNAVLEAGGEAGYHYEEIAQYCKAYPAKAAEVRSHYSEIRELFSRHVRHLEQQTGVKIRSVASHGDFVNRKLGIPNHDMVTPELLDSLGIGFECYDARLLSSYSAILSDAPYPLYYKPSSPFEHIKAGDRVIYLLTHPRHWYPAPAANARDNIRRFIEGIKYNLHV